MALFTSVETPKSSSATRRGNDRAGDFRAWTALSLLLPGSKYEFTFPAPHQLGIVNTIAFNKHGDAVAIATNLERSPRIIIVPQLADKAGFIRKLTVDFLPQRCPEFFPEFGSKTLVHEPEYELPKVLELGQRMTSERDEYERRVTVIDAQIEAEKQQNAWMYQSHTGTGESLVSAVKEALTVLGFSQVEDVDTELDEQGKNRQEDLQILDQSPTIIVDVKGLTGGPKDSDIQQPCKHAYLRIEEWKRTNVISLFVVNHERNLPPLRRTEAFRPEMVIASEEAETGLLTTWDRHRLVRGVWDHNSPLEQVKPLLYKKGRILPLPRHYKALGSVTHSYTARFHTDSRAEGECR